MGLSGLGRLILDNYEYLCKEEFGPYASNLKNDDDVYDDVDGKPPNMQWSEKFPHTPYLAGYPNTTAIDYCLSERKYARGNTCHQWSSLLSKMGAASNIVLGFVSLMIGLSVMQEKQQSTFLSILFRTRFDVYKRRVKKVKKVYAKEHRSSCLSKVLRCLSKEICWEFTPWRDEEGYFSVTRAIEFIFFSLNAARVRQLLPLVVTTVTLLIGFTGSGSLDIALNGLATVFIVELDDIAGEVLFSERFREREKARLRTMFSKVESLNVESKFDEYACQVAIPISVLSMFLCLTPRPLIHCYNIYGLSYFTTFFLFSFLLVLEAAARELIPEVSVWNENNWPKSFARKIIFLLRVAGCRIFNVLRKETFKSIATFIILNQMINAVVDLHNGFSTSTYITRSITTIDFIAEVADTKRFFRGDHSGANSDIYPYDCILDHSTSN